MSFSLDLSKAIENIKENRDKIVRGTLIKVSTDAIVGTPVGKTSLWKTKYPPRGYVGGTLRGAWQASIGTPNLTRTNSVDKSGSKTAGKAAGVINTLEIGSTFYLTNPQPYARRVEFGWSKQRPNGMLRIAIAGAQKALDRLAK